MKVEDKIKAIIDIWKTEISEMSVPDSNYIAKAMRRCVDDLTLLWEEVKGE